MLKKQSSFCGHCVLVYEVCQSFTSTDPVLLNPALAGALGSNRQRQGDHGACRIPAAEGAAGVDECCAFLWVLRGLRLILFKPRLGR